MATRMATRMATWIAFEWRLNSPLEVLLIARLRAPLPILIGLLECLFQVAALCFEKGGDERGMLEALGMYFYQPASNATDTRPPDRLLRAARCFELAGHTFHAASCLKRAGEYTLAARAFRKLGKPVAIAKMLAHAAEKASSRGETLELSCARLACKGSPRRPRPTGKLAPRGPRATERRGGCVGGGGQALSGDARATEP